MKAYLVFVGIAALLITSSIAKAELSLKPGDYFEYDLHWSFIKVGTAKLETSKAPLEENGPEYLHVVLTARTKGIADTLFKVRDRIETWVDPVSGRPIYYKKKQREGKTKRDIEVYFDWEEGTATYVKNGKQREPIPITWPTHNPLSLIIAISGSEFDLNNPKTFRTTDGKEVVPIEVSLIKKERIKTSTGKLDALRLDVATKELEGVFEKSPDASIQIWLNNSGRKYPIKMKSEVIVGSFHGELTKAVLGD